MTLLQTNLTKNVGAKVSGVLSPRVYSNEPTKLALTSRLTPTVDNPAIWATTPPWFWENTFSAVRFPALSFEVEFQRKKEHLSSSIGSSSVPKSSEIQSCFWATQCPFDLSRPIHPQPCKCFIPIFSNIISRSPHTLQIIY